MDGHSLKPLKKSEIMLLNTTDFQRQIEVEEKEDQKRHDEEIKYLLRDAFDDLDNEDVNNSVDITFYLENSLNLPLLSSSKSFNKIEEKISNKTNIVNHEIQNIIQSSRNNIKEKSLNKKIRNYYIISNEKLSDDLILNISTNNESNDYEKNSPYVFNFETPSNHWKNDKLVSSHKLLMNNYTNTFYDKTIRSNIFVEKNKLKEPSTIDNHIKKMGHSPFQIISEIKPCNRSYLNEEQLNVLNLVRIREIEKLTEDIRQIQKTKEETTTLLQKKLSLAELKIKNLIVLKDTAQIDIDYAKKQITELQLKITMLKNVNKNLEKSKADITEELIITKNTVFELEQKVKIIEGRNLLEKDKELSEKCLQKVQKNYSILLQKMQIEIGMLVHELHIKNELLKTQRGNTFNKLIQSEEKMASLIQLNSHDNAKKTINPCCKLKKSHQSNEIIKVYTQSRKKLNFIDDNFNYNSEIKCNSSNFEILQLKRKHLHNQIELSKNEFSEVFTKKDLDKYHVPGDTKLNKMNFLPNIETYNDNNLYILQKNIQLLKQYLFDSIKKIKLLKTEYINILNIQNLKELNEIKHLFHQLNNVVKQLDQLEIKTKQFIRNLSKCIQRNINQRNHFIKGPEIFQNKVIQFKNESRRLIQLSIDLQETQKELDQVKELYINICATKENLVIDHKNHLKYVINKYRYSSTCQDLHIFKQSVRRNFLLNKKLLKTYEEQLKYFNNFGNNTKNNKDIYTNINNIPVKKDAVNRLEKIESINLNTTFYRKTQNNSQDLSISKIKKNYQLLKEYFSFITVKKQLRKKITKGHILISENPYTKKIKSISIDDDIIIKGNMNVILKIEESKKLEVKYKKKIHEILTKIGNLIIYQSKLNKAEHNKIYRMFNIQHIFFTKLNYTYKNNQVSNINNIQENTMKKFREKIERQVAIELQLIKICYKQKVKINKERYDKILLFFKRKLYEKDNKFKLLKKKYNHCIKKKEKIIAELIKIKLQFFQKDITYKILEIYTLQNKLQQIEHDLEDDRNTMARIMLEWILEIQKINLQNKKLEEEVKYLYNARKCIINTIQYE